MDRGAWWAIVHGVAKSWTRLKNEIALRKGGEKFLSAGFLGNENVLNKGKEARSCERISQKQTS